MKLTTWNWVNPPAWYDQQNWFVLGAILMVICVAVFAISMKGKHARQAGEGFFYSGLLNKAVAFIGAVILVLAFFGYSLNAAITASESNNAACAASADANIDRMERYYGIRNVSIANDDKYIMTTYIGMDTRHIERGAIQSIRNIQCDERHGSRLNNITFAQNAIQSISNIQYDERHDSRMANITFTQNGKEYAGTIKSHAGVIQVFRNDGTILKPVNR